MVPRQDGRSESQWEARDCGRSAWAFRGHPSLLPHCTSGWGGAQPNIWSTPLLHSMLESPLECPQVTGCSLHPEVARQLNIFSNVMPLSASPSSITTHLLTQLLPAASVHNE